MSTHAVVQDNLKFVFGWDPPLMSFFLQIHDKYLSEDENPVVWLGTAGSEMYEVEDLVRVAKKHGFQIDSETQTQLYREKDDGV